MPDVRRIVLVGCSGSKLDREAPARELYTGDLFTMGRDWAEGTGQEWYILSALHGVVLPTQVIAPYNWTLDAADFRRPWNREVWTRLECYVQHDKEATFVVLAGSKYCEWADQLPFQRLCDGAGYTRFGTTVRVERPLQGLGIGQQKAALKRMVDALSTNETNGQEEPCHSK